MKYLITLLAILFLYSCQKDETIKVSFHLESNADGYSYYKFYESEDFYILNDTFDSTFMLTLNENYDYVVYMWVYNSIKKGQHANVLAQILVDDVIVEEREIITDICGNTQILLRYRP